MKKVKLDLTTATYKDYIRHFGVKEGAKKWKKRDLKIEKGKREKKYLSDPVQIAREGEIEKWVDDLEPLQKAILGGAERQDIRKTKADIFECGASMVELIGMSAWNKWIKPQIQKDAVDFVRKTLMLSGEESHKATGGYNYARKILKTIDKWVADYTYLMREEEKKQNAISQTRK